MMLISLFATLVLSTAAVTATAIPVERSSPSPLWLRSYVLSNEKYLQATASGTTTGDAALGPTSGKGLFDIVSNQLVQFMPDGSKLYAQFGPLDTVNNGYKLFWSTSPSPNATFSYSAQGTGEVGISVKGVNQVIQSALYNCGGSNVASAVYLSLNAYEPTPAGCGLTTLSSFYQGEYGEYED
ncbi:hypothetical protein M422DRAFT_62970 [Sphaerobolus stellatus SS14]|nr:hypothetical protein M422DRAFT_62970 [Sphaerobolus stellatus SS14]